MIQGGVAQRPPVLLLGVRVILDREKVEGMLDLPARPLETWQFEWSAAGLEMVFVSKDSVRQWPAAAPEGEDELQEGWHDLVVRQEYLALLQGPAEGRSRGLRMQKPPGRLAE